MQEVGGSIPPGSTSLRSLRELRLGKPGTLSRSEVSEGCRGVARLVAPKLAERRRKGEAGPRQLVLVGYASRATHRGVAMKYVYILESLDSQHFYVDITD